MVGARWAIPFTMACGSQPIVPVDGAIADGGIDAGADLATQDVSEAGPLSECDQALADRNSVGCEYFVRSWSSPTLNQSLLEFECLVVALSNDSDYFATATVTFRGKMDNIAAHATLVQGVGFSQKYVDLPKGEIPPHSVALVSLARGWEDSPMLYRAACPGNAVVTVDSSLAPSNALGEAFQLVSSRPIVAHSFAMNLPPNEGYVFTTVTPLRAAGSFSASNIDVGVGAPGRPPYQNQFQTYPSWASVVATTNGTTVKVPTNNGSNSFALNRGDVLTVMRDDAFVGSRISANHPVGVWVGGFTYVPYVNGCNNNLCATDYAFVQAQVAPPWAWANEYAAVRPRDRYNGTPEVFEWRLIAAVDGTMFQYEPSPPSGAPTSLQKGQLATFFASGPFVVRSQDDQHPFYASGTMTGSYYTGKIDPDRRGGPAISQLVSARDFASSYTFFAPSLYPETDLVVVRAAQNGTFEDVTLDCAGKLGGWTPLGSYEYTRVALSRGNYQPQMYSGGTCDNGVHRITSKGRFGATLWGWGSALTFPDPYTEAIAYAFTLVGPTHTPPNPIEPP